jgi:hypothetical protein
MFGMNILMIASETYIAFKLNLAYILINAINIKSAHFKNSRLSESFYYSLVVAMTSIWIDYYTCYFLLLSHDFSFFGTNFYCAFHPAWPLQSDQYIAKMELNITIKSDAYFYAYPMHWPFLSRSTYTRWS